MEMKKSLQGFLPSIEDDETKGQHLLAFYDFCCDLLEEQYGTIPPEEETDRRSLKRLLLHA
ncbi:MAG: hypothetical protein ABSB22_19775 [Thermodesulfobacteriota bacterium]|jgi:hypothetical protein